MKDELLGQTGSPHAQDRALAIGIIAFFAIIIVMALLYTLLDPAMVNVFDMTSSQTSDTTAQDVIDTREQIWGFLPFFGIFLAMVTLIASSVFESRGSI